MPTDPAALGISILSLLVSAGTAFYNYYTKKKEIDSKTKNDLENCILKLFENKSEREKLRYELKNDFDKPQHFARRVTLNDERQFYMSKAMGILGRNRVELSAFESFMIAAALAESGRVEQSLPYYEAALELSLDELDTANIRRAYGRALILTGQSDRGRREMIDAAAHYSRMAHRSSHDRDRLLFEAADAFRRLISAEISTGEIENARDDMKQFDNILKKVIDTSIRSALTYHLDDMKNSIAKYSKETISPA